MRITKENLTRYDQHFKSWQRRRLGYGKALENWKQTEEAGAVSFWPVGGSSLEGKVKFSFTETGPASGDKSPTNPSTITGVNAITCRRAGKNLCSTNNLQPYIANLFTLDLTTGGIKISGTTGSNGGSIEFRSISTSQNVLDGGMLQRGKTYTFSHTGSGSSNNYPYFRLYVKDTATSGWGGARVSIPNGGKQTYTIPSTAYSCLVRIDLGYNTTYDCECFVQIEEGSTATSFEPYSGTDFALSLGNTYYGGEIDLATGLMTVTWEGVVLDGTENWTDGASVGDGVYRYTLLNDYNDKYHPLGNSNQMCSHFNYLQNWTSSTIHWYSNSPAGNAWFFTDAQTSIADWKSWLVQQKTAGSPVTFVAKVSPYTVQLDPVTLTALAQNNRFTPRLNTVYTDADSIQITYQKSPIRAATEQEMAILGLGGNV